VGSLEKVTRLTTNINLREK